MQSRWRRKWQPTLVFLPGESQGWGSLGGLPSMGSHRVGHDWSDLAAAACNLEICYRWACSQGRNRDTDIEDRHVDTEGGMNWESSIDIYTLSSAQSLSRVQLFVTPWTTAPVLPVHHQLPESTQTHVHWVGDDIQPSHPLLSPSPPALNISQHQGLFQWVSSSHQVAKVSEFQLQHQSFQWTPRTDLL